MYMQCFRKCDDARSYSLNIKTNCHLILLKIARVLSYLTLKSGLYHFILGDIYYDSVVYPYCMVMWLYLQNIAPEGHAVCMHIAWFLKYSSLESGHVYIEL